MDDAEDLADSVNRVEMDPPARSDQHEGIE